MNRFYFMLAGAAAVAGLDQLAGRAYGNAIWYGATALTLYLIGTTYEPIYTPGTDPDLVCEIPVSMVTTCPDQDAHPPHEYRSMPEGGPRSMVILCPGRDYRR